MKKIAVKHLDDFKNHLINEEKATATVKKYIHDLYEFQQWLGDRELNKMSVLEYKSYICNQYAPASVNATLSSLNNFFNFMEWHDLRVKPLKIQKNIFSSPDKELSKTEYDRLLEVARKNKNNRLYLLMQTICSTGIRVSEVRYITVKAVECGGVDIDSKGKLRRIFLPNRLCKILKEYIKDKKIKSGAIFITKNGKPLDRSNIWCEMKKICKEANVSEKKVFPHNLRHLFARTYYKLQKDIVRLADILGHSSVDTTRIYTMETGEIHRKQIEKLGLLRC